MSRGQKTNSCYRKCLFIAAPLAMIFSGPPVSAEVDEKIDLAQYAGKWTGTGWGKRHNSAPKESVRCRLNAKYRPATRKLSLSGKCASTGRSFTILGHVAEYPGSNKLTGRWVNPDGIGVMNIKGQRTGNQLQFSFRAKDRKTKKKHLYRTEWRLGRGDFSISTGLSGNDQGNIGKLSFARRAR